MWSGRNSDDLGWSLCRRYVKSPPLPFHWSSNTRIISIAASGHGRKRASGRVRRRISGRNRAFCNLSFPRVKLREQRARTARLTPPPTPKPPCLFLAPAAKSGPRAHPNYTRGVLAPLPRCSAATVASISIIWIISPPTPLPWWSQRTVIVVLMRIIIARLAPTAGHLQRVCY